MVILLVKAPAYHTKARSVVRVHRLASLKECFNGAWNAQQLTKNSVPVVQCAVKYALLSQSRLTSSRINLIIRFLVQTALTFVNPPAISNGYL